MTLGRAEFHLGDIVVHVDHGIAALEGLEEIKASEENTSDAVRLRFAEEAKLLVPADKIGSIWQYGSDADAVTLDHLEGEAWPKRRAKIVQDVAADAARLVQIAAVLSGQVPYGLFLMIVVTYALGAAAIARQGALVQQLNAIESFFVKLSRLLNHFIQSSRRKPWRWHARETRELINQRFQPGDFARD